MANSEPEMLYVSDWASASEATTVPIEDWFSFALKEAELIKLVGLSSKFVMAILIFSVIELIPSVTVTEVE